LIEEVEEIGCGRVDVEIAVCVRLAKRGDAGEVSEAQIGLDLAAQSPLAQVRDAWVVGRRIQPADRTRGLVRSMRTALHMMHFGL
jgi:hypothetical protein